MCDVKTTNTGVISSSYESTANTLTTVTRGTGLVPVGFVETAETLTISTGRDLAVVVDWGNLYQSPWTKPAEIFDRIGALLNEYVESAVLARYGSWTTFDNTGIGGGAGNISVSASNIDDIIRGVKREIRENNGGFQMNQKGVGFVWRAADFEYLEAFIQANGFTTADQALKEGTVEGIHYLGCDHYWSNEHTAGKVFAGVKKIERLGISQGTYGRAFTIDFPASDTNSFHSGRAFYSRIDIGHLTPTAHKGNLFNITVA